MEQKIYDVLCDIRTELSNLRSDMLDVKEELKNIQGDEDYKSNLYELWDEITDFKKEYEKRMDGLLDEDAKEGALYGLEWIHDRLVSIEMDVAAIKSIIED